MAGPKTHAALRLVLIAVMWLGGPTAVFAAPVLAPCSAAPAVLAVAGDIHQTALTPAAPCHQRQPCASDCPAAISCAGASTMMIPASTAPMGLAIARVQPGLAATARLVARPEPPFRPPITLS